MICFFIFLTLYVSYDLSLPSQNIQNFGVFWEKKMNLCLLLLLLF